MYYSSYIPKLKFAFFILKEQRPKILFKLSANPWWFLKKKFVANLNCGEAVGTHVSSDYPIIDELTRSKPITAEVRVEHRVINALEGIKEGGSPPFDSFGFAWSWVSCYGAWY